MTLIGYHASHEQFPPGRLLEWTVRAEAAGFAAGMCSDHFHPWSARQGESGFAWSWLGSALQATRLPFGAVCAPVQRYHPAVIAQATATLAAMYPGRFWVAFGSGELVNERITGGPWPGKPERNARLREAVDIIRALWSGETVTHSGRWFRVLEARLYTRPAEPPLLAGAAVTPATAEWLAGWADALITVSQPDEKLRAVVEAFRRGGGEGKPMFLQAKHSYAESEEAALRGAHEQWRTNIMRSVVLADLATPEEFDAAAAYVRPEDLRGPVRISADLERHAEWLRRDLGMGFERIYLHNVNREQERFIDAFGERVLPALRTGA